MRCTNPLKASQNYKGDIVYRNREAVNGLVGYEFECRKCLPCRLNIAREKAIRCVHEAKMYEGSMFLTLTYNDKALKSPRLIYDDFQLFMKRLRAKVNRPIPMMVTGEYGELTKRPHWHVLLFDLWPKDAKFKYTNHNGDHAFESQWIEDIWGNGITEFGEVTMESAGYVARYSAKKLVHGYDQDHDYHPIHKTSSRYGIGRKWIEKFYEHTFNHGFVVLPNGSKAKVPRYYVDWCKKEHYYVWEHYVTEVRPAIIEEAERKERKEEEEYLKEMYSKGLRGVEVQTRSKVKETILKSKFKKLQEGNKL